MPASLKHLMRNLRRSPASAAAAAVTLSLTLGAAASIFAVVDAVVLTPPPLADPDALVMLGEIPLDDTTGAPRTVAYRTFEAWRERAAPLAAVEAVDGITLTVTGLGPAERLTANNVTSGYLPLLGISPAQGRGFDAGDVGQPVAIVSHALWQGKLAADPAAVGREIVLGGVTHTIVGVLPVRFAAALVGADVWRPFPVTPAQAVLAGYRVRAVGRLAPHVSARELERALDEVSRTSSPPARAAARPVAAVIAGDAPRLLALLAGAAALAMLIAFANLAGLLIVRAIDRGRELAVRSALGAGRAAIAREVLLEAEALVMAGAMGGVLLAWWLTPLAGQITLEQFGNVANREIAVSWRVIAVVAVAAAAGAGIFAMLPAWLTSHRNVVDALRRGATTPSRERSVRRVLVVGEVALALVLLVSLTLVGRSLVAVLRLNPGFEADRVLSLQLALPAANYASPERVVSFYSTLQNRLDERLGPEAVAVIDEIPLTGDGGRLLVSASPKQTGREAVSREAGTSYFAVMRIPLVAGRPFDQRDDAAAPPRVVMSESLAVRLFPSEPAVGRRVWLGADARAAEVVGVAGDVKHRALDEDTLPTVYLSGWQTASRNRILVLRAGRPYADVLAIVREETARLDRNLPVYGTRPLTELVAASPGVPARRVLTATFTGFALLALVLGGIGLFGVVAHDVAARRVELALRIALGASPARIVRATVRQGLLMVSAGLAVGGVLSGWAARVLGAAPFAAGGLDVWSVAAPALVLTLAGVAAVFPTARRAARTDPLLALRSE
jgi:predicted permease